MLVFVLGKLCKETKALDKERAREGVCQPAGVRGELRALLWAHRYPNAGSAWSSATRGGEWQVLATSLCPRELKEGGREKPRRAAGRWSSLEWEEASRGA